MIAQAGATPPREFEKRDLPHYTTIMTIRRNLHLVADSLRLSVRDDHDDFDLFAEANGFVELEGNSIPIRIFSYRPEYKNSCDISTINEEDAILRVRSFLVKKFDLGEEDIAETDALGYTTNSLPLEAFLQDHNFLGSITQTDALRNLKSSNGREQFLQALSSIIANGAHSNTAVSIKFLGEICNLIQNSSKECRQTIRDSVLRVRNAISMLDVRISDSAFKSSTMLISTSLSMCLRTHMLKDERVLGALTYLLVIMGFEDFLTFNSPSRSLHIRIIEGGGQGGQQDRSYEA